MLHGDLHARLGGEGVADFLQAGVTLVAIDPDEQLERALGLGRRGCSERSAQHDGRRGQHRAGAPARAAARGNRGQRPAHKAALTGCGVAGACRWKAWPCASNR